MTNNKLDKQVRSSNVPNPTGKGGFSENPQNRNTEGRPKRKTLTELIHAKLDETPGGWEAIVKTAISKALTDKEVLRTLWQYTDGMPKQGVELTGKDGDAINIKIEDYGHNNKVSTKTKTGV